MQVSREWLLQTELKVAGTKNDYISSEFKTETRKKTVD
jgi:hypothetical protein